MKKIKQCNFVIDFRFRVSPLQLSTFAKLNLDEKTLLNDPNILMDDNLNKQQKSNPPCSSFYEYLTKYFNSIKKMMPLFNFF